MNVIVKSGIQLAEFLAWEKEQPERFEFDGTQPIPMNGGTVAHAWMVRRIIEALIRHMPAGFNWFPGDLKVFTNGRMRYPDVVVIRGDASRTADSVEPVAVFEVLSPSTALTDLRVKPREYASVPSIQVYAILPQDDEQGVVVMRRSNDWQAETAVDRLDLPEIGVAIPMIELFGD